MGTIKVIRSDDGKPYISLEDLINELKTVQTTIENEKTDFLKVVLNTLQAMETEYYFKFLIKTHDNTGES